MPVKTVIEPSLENRFDAYVNCSHYLDRLNHNWANFGYDDANDTLEDYNRSVMKEVKRLKGNKYIRFHGILTSDSNMYTEDGIGKGLFKWDTIDKIYDRVLSFDLKPIVELSWMPVNLAKTGDRESLPKDFRKWRELIYKFIKHLVKRYGENEIKEWFFELWNEPDLTPDTPYFDIENYYKLYDFTVDATVTAFPEIQIGGPSSTGRTSFIDRFLEHCATGRNWVTGKKGTRLDFISYHIYCHSPNRKPISSHFREKFMEVSSLISKYPSFVKLPVLITEWGMTWGGGYTHFPTSYRNDSYAAAFTCKLVKEITGIKSHLILYWGFSEYNFKTDLKTGDFNNMRAIMTYHGIKRPVFGAYEILAMLGERRVYFGRGPNAFKIDGIATADKDSVEILIWNFVDDPDCEEPDATVSVSIENIPIPARKLYYKEFRLDRFKNNSYTAFIKEGRPVSPTSIQLRKIKKEADNVTKPVKIEMMTLKGRSIKLDIQIPMHGIVLARLRPRV